MYLKLHVESVHIEIDFTCENCGKKASKEGNLKKHVQSVHDKAYNACDFCGDKLGNKGNLKKHEKSALMMSRPINPAPK